MSFLENFFGKYWLPELEKLRRRPGALLLSDSKRYLEAIAQSISHRPRPIEVAPSRWTVGWVDDALFLPEVIAFFDDQSLNRKLYVLLTLRSLAARALGLKRKNGLSSRVAQRLEFLSQIGPINSYLDQQFSSHRDFENEIYRAVKTQGRSSGFAKSMGYSVHHDILAFWEIWNQARDKRPTSDILDFARRLKGNDEVPQVLYVTVPCLPDHQGLIEREAGSEKSGQPKDKSSEKANLKREIVRQINLQKEKEQSDNPVGHSFEKMEAVDQYQGGYRTVSGDDEMDSHASGLDEIELNSMTYDGEAAASVYSADLEAMVGPSTSQRSTEMIPGKVAYPEWEHGRGRYLEDYCQLYINRAPVSPSPSNFRQQIEGKYRGKIETWRSKLNQIVCEPLWLRRQIEGSEVDLDAAIRHMADVQAGSSSETRLYMRKAPKDRDISVALIFDQSLSSDSWVNNYRVMDVMAESLGLAGILFEDLLENVLIAGTWSATRHQCDFQVYKGFNQSWDDFYKVGEGIQPRGYTRLGPAIRHATHLFEEVKSHKKILFLFTDGKPTDLDRYEGVHGIQDVRKACEEAEQKGIFTYALAIEQDRKARFSTMFRRYSLMTDPSHFFDELFGAILKALE